jgi:hypothetical protein
MEKFFPRRGGKRWLSSLLALWLIGYCALAGKQAAAGQENGPITAADQGAAELYPRVGFIVTNLARPAERVVGFYNQLWHGGAVDQGRQERDQMDRLSCRTFAANADRLQLHALAYNLGNFMRTLAMPKTAQPWSLTSLREKLIKIGSKVVSHGRYVTFQMAEVAVSRQMFADILSLIARLRAPPAPA